LRHVAQGFVRVLVMNPRTTRTHARACTCECARPPARASSRPPAPHTTPRTLRAGARRTSAPDAARRRRTRATDGGPGGFRGRARRRSLPGRQACGNGNNPSVARCARRACTLRAACLHVARGVLARCARRACTLCAACLHVARGVLARCARRACTLRAACAHFPRILPQAELEGEEVFVEDETDLPLEFTDPGCVLSLPASQVHVRLDCAPTVPRVSHAHPCCVRVPGVPLWR
jgi:hypothetical protein